MPNQKMPKFFAQPEQVFDEERQAHFDAQRFQAEKDDWSSMQLKALMAIKIAAINAIKELEN